MTRSNRGGWSRRDFLQLSWTLGAGVALPAGLTGCGGDNYIGETFREPQTLVSERGVLDVTLTLRYANATLNNKDVFVRSMNSSIPAPTLRVNTGDLLRIKVVNDLPPNPASSEPAKHLRYPNSTNLHTHGLHVNPGLVSPGIYGDFVVDDPDMGVQPGQSRQHEFRIEPNHPAGAYWYHPHLHGSTAIQLGSGMAGALIISGQINKVPEIAAAAERVFMFQSPITNGAGRLESFAQVADQPSNERNYLINGMRRPRLSIRRGEVQNWHFINAFIFNFLNLLNPAWGAYTSPNFYQAFEAVDASIVNGKYVYSGYSTANPSSSININNNFIRIIQQRTTNNNSNLALVNGKMFKFKVIFSIKRTSVECNFFFVQ